MDIKRKGEYELFRATRDHTVLVLDGTDYLLRVETADGEVLVKSDADHEREAVLETGDYVLLAPKPHHPAEDWPDGEILKLRDRHANRNTRYRLPEGLPDEYVDQKPMWPITVLAS